MYTSIYWASRGGFADVVQCLLEAKADANIPNEVSVLLLYF